MLSVVNILFSKDEEGRYEWVKKITFTDSSTEKLYQDRIRKKSARAN